MHISDERKKRVQDFCNAKDTLEYLGLSFRRSGEWFFCSANPFRSEKSVSLATKSSWRTVKDFGNDKMYDSIGIVQELQNLSFPDAIVFLENAFCLTDANFSQTIKPLPIQNPASKEIFYIPEHIWKKSLQDIETDPLFLYLCEKFDTNKVYETFQKFNIGTKKASRKFSNGKILDVQYTIFWYFDKIGCRNGKFALYENGHKVSDLNPEGKKQTIMGAAWAIFPELRQMKNKNANFTYPLYNAQNINPKQFIKIVESEKTALIASIKGLEGSWVANINRAYELSEVLNSSSEVIIYTDLDSAGRKKAEDAKEELTEIGFQYVSVYDQQPEATDESHPNYKKDLADFLCGECAYISKEQWEKMQKQKRKNKALNYANTLFAGQELTIEEIQDKIEIGSKFNADLLIDSLIEMKIIEKIDTKYRIKTEKEIYPTQPADIEHALDFLFYTLDRHYQLQWKARSACIKEKELKNYLLFHYENAEEIFRKMQDFCIRTGIYLQEEGFFFKTL